NNALHFIPRIALTDIITTSGCVCPSELFIVIVIIIIIMKGSYFGIEYEIEEAPWELLIFLMHTSHSPREHARFNKYFVDLYCGVTILASML
ncbi:hypothetical protein ACJX0J_016971, partial [Zea mays]